MFGGKLFRNFTFFNPLCMAMLKVTIKKVKIIQEKKISTFWYIYMLSLSFHRSMLLWYYVEIIFESIDPARLTELKHFTMNRWLQTIVGVNLLRHYLMNFSEIRYQSFQIYPLLAQGILTASIFNSKTYPIVSVYMSHHPLWTIYFFNITAIQELFLWPSLLDVIKGIYNRANHKEAEVVKYISAKKKKNKKQK